MDRASCLASNVASMASEVSVTCASPYRMAESKLKPPSRPRTPAVESHIPHVGNAAQEIVARHGARGGNLVGSEHGDRQRYRQLCTLDVRADDLNGLEGLCWRLLRLGG